MPAIIHECPHCGAEKMGFEIVAQYSDPRHERGARQYRVVMTCLGCRELIVGRFVNNGASRYNSPGEVQGDPGDFGWGLIETYPTPAPSKCPDHTPDALKRVFLQAANALKRGDPDASGAMSRKVVDNSTQMLLADKAKDYKNIYERIEALKDRGLLTPDLAKWAHAVRLGGADAAHDLDPFTKEEADELLDFAELYLIYVYSLPERLKLRRERAKAEKEAAGANPSN